MAEVEVAEDTGAPAAGPRGLTRRRLLLGGAVVLAAGGGGLGYALDRRGGTRRPAAPGVPELADVTALLDRQAAAVRRRDRAGFLAPIDTAQSAYLTRMEQVFDDLMKLPLSGWRQTVDPLPAVAHGAYGAVVRVTQRYRLTGFDRGDVVGTRYLTLTRRGGPWMIAGDGTRAGMADDAQIWDDGPLTVARGRHSLVIGTGTLLAEVARRLDEAVPIVSGVVGDGWARTVVALAPADDQQVEGLLGDGQGLRDIAALATVTKDPAGHGQDRIIITPDGFGKLNALGRHVVLTHELTHIATGAAKDGRTPLWLIEGLADYVGYKGTGAATGAVARELKAGRPPANLPGPDDFGSSSDHLPQAYEEAWLACRMIAQRYGEPALMRLYRAAGRQDADAACRGVLGRTLAELTADWRAYVHHTLGS